MRLVVTSHNPWRRRLFFIAMVLFILGASWSMYELGRMQAGYNKLEAIQEQLELNGRISTLKDENKTLREQLTMLERTQAVDRESTDDVRNNIKQLQDEILELREEADFYRGIISPANRQAGLDIQSFKLSSGGEAGLYHFDLVMTQVLANDRVVRGEVKLAVQGVQGQMPVTLSFSDLSPNNSVSGRFQFRYYEKLAGDVRLPEGFVPRTVQVELTSAGRKPVNKSFPWVVQK
jgi:hypothetical protein